ncbi:MAG: class I SAM-dependent methyltransferase [Burkholderiales bacterium]
MNSSQIAALVAGRKVLDVGCGRNKFPGAIGIDFAQNSLADIMHDLNKFPFPIEENSFDVVLCRNVIEHIQDVVGLMEEIHRIGRNSADVVITTPHFSSLYSYQDPTHLRHLAFDSMDYFTEETKHSNFYSSKRFKMAKKEIDFGKSFPFSSIAKCLFVLSPHKYEKHFAFMFPCNSLSFHLKIVK